LSELIPRSSMGGYGFTLRDQLPVIEEDSRS
jgi:hypothetical protein